MLKQTKANENIESCWVKLSKSDGDLILEGVAEWT